MPSLSPPPLASPVPRKAGAIPPARTPAPAYSPQPRVEADADARLAARNDPTLMQRAKWSQHGRKVLGMKRSELMLLGSVVVLAVFVRMYKLHQPTSVV
jgi:hypothetical protein